MQLESWPLDRLKPYGRNPRTHSANQIEQLARSITEFGFTNPILVHKDGTIIAGHGRLQAAAKAGLTQVPVLVLGNLTDSQRRALVIADNQLALNAGWNDELLAAELEALRTDGFELELVGFTDEELSALLADVVNPFEGSGDGEGTKEIVDEGQEKIAFKVLMVHASRAKEVITQALIEAGIGVTFC